MEGFTPAVPRPPAEGLADRLAQVLALAGEAPGPGPLQAQGDAAPALATLPYDLDEAQRTVGLLGHWAPSLPRTLIHGGCRRGSFRFQGPALAAVLDSDVARWEARVIDLGIAVHDFAKRYGDPQSDDYKVALDPDVACRFLHVYSQANPPTDQEIEALPALLAAKRLHRSLGRYRRLLDGTTTPGDTPKVMLEMSRVQ